MGGCRVEKNTKKVYDPRYVSSGLHSNAFKLRFDSNVDQHMNSLPHYYQFGPDGRELEQYVVGSWNRPTLSWSLECEA